MSAFAKDVRGGSSSSFTEPCPTELPTSTSLRELQLYEAYQDLNRKYTQLYAYMDALRRNYAQQEQALKMKDNMARQRETLLTAQLKEMKLKLELQSASNLRDLENCKKMIKSLNKELIEYKSSWSKIESVCRQARSILSENPEE